MIFCKQYVTFSELSTIRKYIGNTLDPLEASIRHNLNFAILLIELTFQIRLKSISGSVLSERRVHERTPTPHPVGSNFLILFLFFLVLHLCFKAGVRNSNPMAGQKEINVQGPYVSSFYTNQECFHEKSKPNQQKNLGFAGKIKSSRGQYVVHVCFKGSFK